MEASPFFRINVKDKTTGSDKLLKHHRIFLVYFFTNSAVMVKNSGASVSFDVSQVVKYIKSL